MSKTTNAPRRNAVLRPSTIAKAWSAAALCWLARACVLLAAERASAEVPSEEPPTSSAEQSDGAEAGEPEDIAANQSGRAVSNEVFARMAENPVSGITRIVTVNWERSPGDRATLPVGIGFGRHIRLPKRPRLGLTTRYSGFYNALRTDQGAKWQLVATLVFWKPNPLVFDEA